MKNVLSAFILFLTASCVSTVEPTLHKNDKIKTSDKVKIMSKASDYITFIIPINFTNIEPMDKPEWLSTAKNHCTAIKKNTYYAYKPKEQGFFGFRKVYDFGYQKGSDGQERMVYRFICAKNRDDARLIAYREGGPHRRDFWGYNNNPIVLEEFKRYVSPKEIAENKAKAEKERLAKLERDRKEKALKRQKKIVTLETSFGEACTSGTFKKGFTKGTQEYENCLFQKEKEAIAKQKAIDEKLAKMTPVQRREYNCEETFQFRKGSDKFKDCVFKLYTTELELQKLELQKQVAEAKLEAEKAKAKAAATEKARADAVARAQIAAAEAQKAAAKSQSLATSMSLMQLGSSMMSSPAPAPSNTGRVRTTCRNVGGFLNCY